MSARYFFVIGCLVLITGCASLPRDGGFGEVEKQGATRLATAGGGEAPHLRWVRSGADEAHVAEHLREAFAQPLTVRGAVQVALLKNPQLQATYERLGIAQADFVQAGLVSNPLLEARDLFDTYGGGSDLEVSIALNAAEMLWRPLRRRVAEAELEATKAEVARAMLLTALEAQRGFYAVQAAERGVELGEASVLARRAAAEYGVRLFQVGNMSADELYGLQAEEADESREQAARLRALAAARRGLNGALGLTPDEASYRVARVVGDVAGSAEDETALTLGDASDFGGATRNDVTSHALARSLDLAALRARGEAAAQAVGSARGEALFPELELGVAGERDDAGRRVGPTLAMRIPIFDWGRARRAAAEGRLRAAHDLYAARVIEIKGAAAEMTSRTQVLSLAAMAARREARLRAARSGAMLLQYNAMQVGVFELLEAKTEEIEAQRRAAGARRDFWVARAELGTLLAGAMADESYGGENSTD